MDFSYNFKAVFLITAIKCFHPLTKALCSMIIMKINPLVDCHSELTQQ